MSAADSGVPPDTLPGGTLPPSGRSRLRAPSAGGPSSAAAVLLVGAGVLGISLAAPIGAVTLAPPLAVAFWRSAGGALATAPVLALRHRAELAVAPRVARRGAVLAGALLAVHFALWLPSLRLTSVTASTALVTTTPVWTVGLARLRGAPVPRPVLTGVAAALVGVLAITGVDAGHGGAALLGDLLALAGGMAAAGYVVVGERVRRDLSTAVYTVLGYGSCAVLLAVAALVAGVPLAGWGPGTWAELAAMTVAAQLLGHTALNAALPAVGATTVSLAILLEVPGAALVAWAWLGVVPPWTVLPGAGLVLLGLVRVVRAGRVGAGVADPPELQQPV
ncbi:MAG: DMT family transporter [Kineosporiaceae bacterium]|jgi:drug/metabolite transporter (DMT)-like permease